MRDRIYITEEDSDRLRRLVTGRRAASSNEQEILDLLEQELDRAEVVKPEALPHDVISMNSDFRLKDLDSGREQRYKLVFPNQSRGDNAVSVLAPIGMAVLGYRVGDVIEWPVPKGVRRLEVLEVIYQPEARETHTV
ncbi:MAG: nucleoside diphosphate kinase regulator [Bryobacterales bacterium]|nr:nucleoside diphosphate kinase regulator [Bryobacterales bacterium]